MTKARQLFKNKIRIMAKLFRDSETPLWMKMLMIFCIIYVISPIDLIPDITPIPLVGLIDDVLLIWGVASGLGSTTQGQKYTYQIKKESGKTIIEGK